MNCVASEESERAIPDIQQMMSEQSVPNINGDNGNDIYG